MPRYKYLLEEPLSERELALCASELPLKFAALSVLLFHTGMRIGEALSLRWRDLQVLEDGLLISFKTEKKRQKGPITVKREILLTYDLPYIEILLRHLQSQGGLGRERIFDFTRFAYWRKLKQILPASPHAFRHSFAIRFLMKRSREIGGAAAIAELVRAMGHADARMALKYAQHVGRVVISQSSSERAM